MNTNQAGKLCILYPLQNFPDFINRIQAQIAFNRSDFSPNNQRQIYEEFGIAMIFERFLSDFDRFLCEANLITIRLDSFIPRSDAKRVKKPHYPSALSKILAFLYLRIVKRNSFCIHDVTFLIFLHQIEYANQTN